MNHLQFSRTEREHDVGPVDSPAHSARLSFRRPEMHAGVNPKGVWEIRLEAPSSRSNEGTLRQVAGFGNSFFNGGNCR